VDFLDFCKYSASSLADLSCSDNKSYTIMVLLSFLKHRNILWRNFPPLFSSDFSECHTDLKCYGVPAGYVAGDVTYDDVCRIVTTATTMKVSKQNVKRTCL